jgi:hypothetical protein
MERQMGVAAYNRGTAVIAAQIAANDRAPEFQMMDALNALEKFSDAGCPFGPINFVPGRNGFWAECPSTGFGYWYPSLREAVRRWNVSVTSYDGSAWGAVPN